MSSRFEYLRSFASVVLLIVLTTGLAWAQGAEGGIVGDVADPSGATVSGALVTATNLQTGFVREVKTDATGAFRFTVLDPGQYRVEIVARGFKKLTREPITVRITETTDLRLISLQVGAAGETVTVTVQAPLLQTTDSTLGKVFDSEMVVNLPLVTRNFTQLLALQPGVVTDIPNGAAQGNGTTGFSVAGSRYYENSVLINGVDAMGSTVLSGPLTNIAIPAPDTIEEFKVQTGLYSAEYGRAGGASVNLVTKSGTNKFHGTVYEYFRNEALDANDYFFKASELASGEANKPPLLRQNQFGGTFGGSIKKNRTFFFVSYQGTRQLNGAAPGLNITNDVYPLLPQGDRSDTGTLQQQLGAIYGGRTGILGGNPVAPDGSNINPVSLKILQAKLPNGTYLLPGFSQSSLNDGMGGLNGGQVYSDAGFTFPSPFDEDQYIIDIDHSISSRQTVSGKFFSANQSLTAPANQVPGFIFRTTPSNRNLAITDTFVFSPTLLNELRIGYTRLTVPTHRQDPITAADVGMGPAPDSHGMFPALDIADSDLEFGDSYYINTSAENLFIYGDTLSKIIGAHSLHLGAVFIRHQLNLDQDEVATGQLILGNFSDFLLGENGVQNGSGFSNILATFASTGGFAKALRYNDLSPFIQDDWKVTDRLTLNIGLRWDYFGWPTDAQGRIANFDVRKIAEGSFGTPPPQGSYTGYTVAKKFAEAHSNAIPAGVAIVSNTGLDGEDYNNFDPRLGFSWQPGWLNRIVFRGGYGIFRSRVSAITVLSNIIGPPFNRVGLAELGPDWSFQDPYSVLDLPPDSAFPLWTPRQYIPGQEATVFLGPTDPTVRTPYTQQWTLNTQYQFGRNYLLEVAYVASHGLKLLNCLAGNQPAIASPENPIRGVTTNTDDPGNFQARSPIAGIVPDEGTAVTHTNAASIYEAGTVSLNKRYSSGLEFLSAFTFGKSMDDQSLLPQGDTSNQEPPGNSLIQHWGLSTFDRKLRSTTSVVYDLPNLWKGNGSTTERLILGGWETSGIMTFQSGNPVTFEVNSTVAGSAVKSQGALTPNLVPGTPLSALNGKGTVKRRLNQYFGSPGVSSPDSLFLLPSAVEYGQLGRGLPIRSPGQKQVDWDLAKTFPLRENVNLQFRIEAFNVFNWVNFGTADAVVTDPGFGIISSASTAPRILQLALRVNF